jgi:NAD(P)H-hydrate epimerase
MPLPEQNGAISPTAASLVLANDRKINAAVFGPGLSQEPGLQEFLREVWKSWAFPCVIDADALNAMSAGIQPPPKGCVLTPHPGEMSRLLGVPTGEIQEDRFAAIKLAASRLNHTVLLKGANTLSRSPMRPTMVNTTGNAGMAAGGTGDVLSGVIGTLLAQGVPPKIACACGIYWHGAAGDHCQRTIGDVGYTASEVADSLPAARARIISTIEPNLG